jgi:hypothetical protein
MTVRTKKLTLKLVHHPERVHLVPNCGPLRVWLSHSLPRMIVRLLKIKPMAFSLIVIVIVVIMTSENIHPEHNRVRSSVILTVFIVPKVSRHSIVQVVPRTMVFG